VAVFEYKAVDKQGKYSKGVIDASSEEEVRSKLRRQSLFPVEVVQSEPAPPSLRPFLRRINPEDISLFTHQLASLLKGGLPLVPSLNALAEQMENHPLGKIVLNLAESVKEGKSLGEALSLHPRVFSPTYINMVKAGESAGSLQNILFRIFSLTRENIALGNKIKNALIYPLVVGVVGIGVLIFLLVVVVPTLSDLFTQMGETLPPITLGLIAVASFLQKYWIVLLISLGVIIGLFSWFAHTPSGRKTVDSWKLNLPLIGNIIQKSLLLNFARTLSTLRKGGVAIVTSLELSKNSLRNELISEAIIEAKEGITRGESLGETLEKSGVFPSLFIHMVKVGEKSGNLEEMLDEVSSNYAEEVQISLARLTSLLEPLIILTIGVVVGYIAVSILLPIFEMNQFITLK